MPAQSVLMSLAQDLPVCAGVAGLAFPHTGAGFQRGMSRIHETEYLGPGALSQRLRQASLHTGGFRTKPPTQPSRRAVIRNPSPNAKYSVRVDIFRFAFELRHCSVRAVLRICANTDLSIAKQQQGRHSTSAKSAGFWNRNWPIYRPMICSLQL